MEEFVAVHKVQLLSSSIPEHLWESLYLKLKLEVMSNRTARKSSSGVPQWGGQCRVGCRGGAVSPPHSEWGLGRGKNSEIFLLNWPVLAHFE